MFIVTPQVTKLYNALMNRGVKCKMEDNDGYKTVDISIPEARIYVEVDGLHHYTDPIQMRSDFERSYWSYKRNDFDTIHIPNIIIDSQLDRVADALSSVAKRYINEIEENNRGLWNKIRNFFN